jgi:two-component system, cell cycle sensor histidine kinase and response regulator CckA
MNITVPISESDQAAESLTFLQTLIDTVPNPLFHADRDGRYRFCNPAFADLFGREPADIIGKTIAELVPSVIAGNAVLHQHPGRHIVPLTLLRKTGGLREVEFHYATVPGPDGQVAGIAGMVIDFTEIRKSRGAPYDQQKLDALEIVTGGIAHDLKNMMGVVIGNLETALQYEIPPADPSRESVTDALNAGLRAKVSIRHLVTFVRKLRETLAPLPLSILVKETLKTFHFQSIAVEHDIAPDSGPVMADVTQIHQLLLSLIDHAVQSMGQLGGRIRVALKHVDITPVMARKLNLPKPGPFEALAITRTDYPENPRLRPPACESVTDPAAWNPGNSLGLDSLHGIVRNHNGAIEYENKSANSSQVTVYFPAVQDADKG